MFKILAVAIKKLGKEKLKDYWKKAKEIYKEYQEYRKWKKNKDREPVPAVPPKKDSPASADPPHPDEIPKGGDAISPKDFGVTKEQTEDWWNLPAHFTIDRADRGSVVFSRPGLLNAHRDPGYAYRTVISDGRTHAYSAGVSSHGTRKQLNAEGHFKDEPVIYYCVFEMVEKGKKMGRARSQIYKHED